MNSTMTPPERRERTSNESASGAQADGVRNRSIVDLDVIANAITPDLLRPYVAPQRPIALGSAATHFMRAAYDVGVELDAAARADAQRDVQATDRVSRHAVSALTQSVASALGATVVSEIDWTHPERVQVDASAWRDAVVVCADALAHVANPTALVALLSEIQRVASVLVISVPLREFTLTIDDVGPPTRIDRVREWAFPEVQALLDAAGLDVVFGGLIPETAADVRGQTAVFVAIRRVTAL